MQPLKLLAGALVAAVVMMAVQRRAPCGRALEAPVSRQASPPLRFPAPPTYHPSAWETEWASAATEEAANTPEQLCSMVRQQTKRVREWISGVAGSVAALAARDRQGGQAGSAAMPDLSSTEVFSHFEFRTADGSRLSAPIEPLVGHFRWAEPLCDFILPSSAA